MIGHIGSIFFGKKSRHRCGFEKRRRGAMRPSSRSLPSLALARPRGAARIDHLGKQIDYDRSRHKYGRTWSIAWNHSRPQLLVKLWALMADARRAAGFSISMLHRLNERFSEALDSGVMLVGPHTFQLVLNAGGVTDKVLLQRLFDGFAELSGSANVEYRELVRAFASVSGAPVEEKIDLLFTIYDGEGDGTLSLSELTQIIAKTTKPEELHAVLVRPMAVMAREAAAATPVGAPAGSTTALMRPATVDTLQAPRTVRGALHCPHMVAQAYRRHGPNFACTHIRHMDMDSCAYGVCTYTL